MYSDIYKYNKNNRKKYWNISLSMLVLISSMLFLTSCGWFQNNSFDGLGTSHVGNSTILDEKYDANDTWALYWYLCGTDLETDYGYATEDLEEMLQVKLPKNVSIIIETGGARRWKSGVDAGNISRYLYNSDGLQLLEKQNLSSMGSSSTLESFLRFCNNNYPADHKAVIFWDHGGGSTGGVIFDEIFGYDSLSLPEIRAAFEAVNEPSKENPPYEMIGFDACLMATVDMVETLNGFGRFMVASQETEPGDGWDYTSFLTALAKDTGMNGARLGKEICDSYYESNAKALSAWTVTLSVVDLRSADALKTAYDNVGAEALANACITTSYFSEFGRAARAAESYGANNDKEGYTNMVDMGDLVRQLGAKSLLPEYGQALLDTLQSCVVYRVNGPFRARAEGLSCYYDYEGSNQNLAAFKEIGNNTPFYWFYEYAITGKLSAEGMEFVQTWAEDKQLAAKDMDPQEVKAVAMEYIEDYPITVTEEGKAVLAVGTYIASQLVDVYCSLAYYSEADDLMIFLGTDNNLEKDWINGVFTNNFKGEWGSIDKTPVHMEIIDVGKHYQLYKVPVMLNHEEYTLIVSYVYDSEKYEILGARKELSENGMPDKNLRALVPGDVVEPVLYIMQEDEKQFQEIILSEITVTEKTKFEKMKLEDGKFISLFEMVDIHNNRYFSEAVIFEVTGKKFSIIEE